MARNGHQRTLNQLNKCFYAYFICGTALTCPLEYSHWGNIWCARIRQLSKDICTILNISLYSILWLLTPRLLRLLQRALRRAREDVRPRSDEGLYRRLPVREAACHGRELDTLIVLRRTRKTQLCQHNVRLVFGEGSSKVSCPSRMTGFTFFDSLTLLESW